MRQVQLSIFSKDNVTCYIRQTGCQSVSTTHESLILKDKFELGHGVKSKLLQFLEQAKTSEVFRNFKSSCQGKCNTANDQVTTTSLLALSKTDEESSYPSIVSVVLGQNDMCPKRGSERGVVEQ